MAMNEQQPVENKKVSKNETWKPVVIGGVSGIALGGVATAAVAATADDTTAEAVVDGTTLTGVDGSAHVDSSVPVAQVSDGMSFSEAFHSAHDQVGPGGVFVWHGQVYSTFTEDEWNSMTPAEQAEFGNHVHVQYDEPSHASAQLAAQSAPAVEVVSEPAANTGTHDEQVAHAGTQEPQVTVAQQPEQTNVTEGEVPQVEPEVLAYETVSGADGSQMDVAVVSVGGQAVGVYDVNQDGTADLMVSDENNNQQIEENEIHDISSQDVSMQALHDDYMAQNDPSMQGPDYINDGNVDNYMA